MYLSDLKKLDDEYIAHTYHRMDQDVVRGSGATCRDGQGKAVIDFSSGVGVNSVGFTNPAWTKAVKDQVDALAHISNYFYTQPSILLAKALCERTGMKRVFFGNSGAEANECAIKTARKYAADKYGPGRYEIITLANSFHGRTIATLAATGQDGFHRHFGPFPDGFTYATANDSADLLGKISDKTAAIMIECVQGEGGVIPLEQSFADAIKQVCAERDILLVVDEVQTGVGRTGSFVCYSQLGLQPDVVTLAKGLGGGLPIGACLMGEKTKDTLGTGDHGSTFGGNPVACAGALAIMDTVDGKFLDDVAEKGAYIKEQLLAMDGVTGVTGKGMMIGILLEEKIKAPDVMAACLKQGLIVLTAKEKVRLLPPLTITKEEIDGGLAILRKTLKELKEEAK